jgi:isoamylase
VQDDFDWGSDRPLELPAEDLVIYEMHVRGFTAPPLFRRAASRHFSRASSKRSPTSRRWASIAVELMPVYEFNEWENSRDRPDSNGEAAAQLLGLQHPRLLRAQGRLCGHRPVCRTGMQVDELKTLVKNCTENGIEVILDVVFNHTAEGNEQGPTI